MALLIALWTAKPGTPLLREAARLLPDLIRLVTRLGRERSLPRRTRVLFWLLLGFLAMPIDLVPDFIPVLGYADDAILVVWTLRAVIRQAGPAVLRRHWPGSQRGLLSVERLAGLRR